jgi:LPXTG-motif cell wall-anchored protein
VLIVYATLHAVPAAAQTNGGPVIADPTPDVNAFEGGSQVPMSGTGCQPGESVEVTFNDRPAGASTAGPDGSWTVTLRVPTLHIDDSVPNARESSIVVTCGGSPGRQATRVVAYEDPVPAVVIAPGTFVRIHGRGCAPGADVTVNIGSLHGSGDTLDTFPADSAGRFTRVLPIPFHGEATATVTANCIGAAGSTVTAFDLGITYIGAGELPATGDATALALTAIGGSLILVGTGLRMSAPGARARRGTP